MKKLYSFFVASIYPLVYGILPLSARAGGLADRVTGGFDEVEIVRTDDSTFWPNVWKTFAYVCIVLYFVIGLALVYFIIRMIKARSVSNYEREEHAKKIIRLLVILAIINTVIFLFSFFLVRAS